MSLHNHLHVKTKDEEEEQLSMYPFIIAIGLVGMLFTIVGNVKQTTEMYSHFLQCSECLYFHVPVSFYFTVFSDGCLILYGVFNNDFGIILDLTCKRGSVGQSEGLSIPRSSVRFRPKPIPQILMNLNFIDPPARVLSYF